VSAAEIVLWLLPVVPAVVGGVLALSRGAERVAVPVSLVTAAVTAVLAAVAAVTRPEVSAPFIAGADIGLSVDALAALVLPTVGLVTFLVLVFAAGEDVGGSTAGSSRARFHGLMLLFAAAAMMTAAATTLPALLFAWEVMGATSYALIGFWWRDQPRVSAGLTAFLTTRTADLGLYLAAGAALAGGAGLTLAALPEASSGWRHVIAAGILVAALGKAAQLPFSFWLSRAMEGPSPVSALLHSAAMVALGGYLLLRVQPLLAATGWAAPATAWAGAVTAVLLGGVAIAQRDVKQLLAASTSAQLGYVVLAAGVGSISGGAAHLVAHAATKALLFLAAGAWLTALGTKQLGRLHGVGRRWPVAGWSATVGALSLAGVVPLSLWATKDAVLAAARHESVWLYVAGLAGAALSAGYAGRLLWVLWRRVPAADAEELHGEEGAGTGEVGLLEWLPLVVLAAGAAVLGVLALPPLAGRLAEVMGDPVAPEASAWEMALSAVIALAVVVAVGRWRAPVPRRLGSWLDGWLGLEGVAHLVVVRPTLRLAGALARFDDHVLDAGVHRVSAATVSLAVRSARADDRGVDGLVQRFGSLVGRLGALARRPQTGQLHQYYLQAVAALAIGVLVLVALR
jgi:NADH:ubiquinone oxidoreductase subunit 5 (subunit L)/multisubunit Na+/H+ antiporter MnhA subunit